ncbi:hypothetical protein CDAR_470641 [Caerostris darwini]|uniref:Uncharacterized protein n=1 Tax=Caerostris darwini TaxID=1538125 RepID=A0AAV4VHS8_9ARAC|nr:hypothetical protein CDAR_470641 [Caerostris darwini]
MDNGDAVPMQPVVFIKQEPIDFDPQPSTSSDIVIKDAVPVQPAVFIKQEPINFDPEPSTSSDIVIKDAVPVQPAVFIKQEPINFDPEPSTSADIVIKDEFVVCNEAFSGSSTNVPPSTEPTSHVTLSVACLGSSEQPDIGR